MLTRPFASFRFLRSRTFRLVFLMQVGFGLSYFSGVVAAQESADPVESNLRADLEFLADDKREGRGLGTQGLSDSANMIAERFSDLGLDTSVFADSPFQVFTVPNGYEAAIPKDPSQPAKNRLQITGQMQADLELGVQWMPLSLGSNGEFSGQLVFVGYGISAPNLNYDDYANLNVNGKVVVVLRKQPFQNQEDSRFGEVRNSRYAYFSTKETNAALKGASAMIIVNDSITASGDAGDRLFEVSDGGRAMGRNSIPTMHLLRETIDPILQQGTGKTLQELEEQIESSGQPASVELNEMIASGATEVQRKQTEVKNVVGILPGTGSLADQYLVIGAHYDHVGLGGPGSLAPGTIEVHNGADDNASGTAVLLETARQLAQTQNDNRCGILFIAFTAEESGLLGSKHYVRHPPIPIENTVAMINLDMVGRLHEGSLTAYGTGTASEFPAWLEELAEPIGIKLDLQSAGYGPSDHQSFHEVGLPVIHFFSGMHNQYHRPSDDAPLIDWEGMRMVTELTTSLAVRIATHETPLTRLRNESRARIGPNAGRPRAVLGISLDGEADGCLVSAVSEGSAAEKGGILVDDLIIKLDDNLIGSSSDLLQAMRNYKVGDEVSVVILRSGKEIEAKVKLGTE